MITRLKYPIMMINDKKKEVHKPKEVFSGVDNNQFKLIAVVRVQKKYGIFITSPTNVLL